MSCCFRFDHMTMIACPGMPRIKINQSMRSVRSHTDIYKRIRIDHISRDMIR